MTREKHGQYDPERGLPNNDLQPQGSGTTVWLIKQVLAFPDGEAIVEHARQYGPKRYTWLCERLVDAGYVTIVEEYKKRKKEDALYLTYKEKQREIVRLQEEILEGSDPWYSKEAPKRIAKLQKYLDTHKEIPLRIQQRESQKEGEEYT